MISPSRLEKRKIHKINKDQIEKQYYFMNNSKAEYKKNLP